MTLVFESYALNGYYFYTKTLKDIRVNGTVTDDRSLTLDEYDAKGIVSARFKGRFLEEDPKGRYAPGTKLTCDVMSGVWEDVATGRTQPFYLRVSYAVVGPLNNRYQHVGANTEKVERTAQRFLRAVRKNDRKEVAGMVHYPLQVYVDGVGPKTINNENEFLLNFEAILSKRYRENLESAIPKHMFWTKGLIMIGRNGPPFIGPDLKIRL